MAVACRSVISDWWTLDRDGGNAGLLRDRFLRIAVKDKKNHPQARDDLFKAMCQSLDNSQEIYVIDYQKQESAIKNLNSKGFFNTGGRMIIGLGGENVLETGLTLNHTYGTPMIPEQRLRDWRHTTAIRPGGEQMSGSSSAVSAIGPSSGPLNTQVISYSMMPGSRLIA
jgi:hypothetical protein